MNPRAAKMFAPPPPGAKLFIGVGTGVIVSDDVGRILLELRADCGLWGLPGGGVQPGESVTNAARREVREETGLDVRITRLLGVYSDPAKNIVTYPDNGDVKHKIDILLEGEITGGKLAASAESERLEFFEPGRVPLDLLNPQAAGPVRDYLAGRFGVVE